jgi:hypothetical protein
MRSKRLALVNRARMSVLNAIGRFADTDAEEHLRYALTWLNAAVKQISKDESGIYSLDIARSHLENASRSLGFVPVEFQ